MYTHVILHLICMGLAQTYQNKGLYLDSKWNRICYSEV